MWGGYLDVKEQFLSNIIHKRQQNWTRDGAGPCLGKPASQVTGDTTHFQLDTWKHPVKGILQLLIPSVPCFNAAHSGRVSGKLHPSSSCQVANLGRPLKDCDCLFQITVVLSLLNEDVIIWWTSRGAAPILRWNRLCQKWESPGSQKSLAGRSGCCRNSATGI